MRSMTWLLLQKLHLMSVLSTERIRAPERMNVMKMEEGASEEVQRGIDVEGDPRESLDRQQSALA